MAPRNSKSSDLLSKNQRLTDTIVKALPLPAKGGKVTYDSEVRGFGCQVSKGGTRAFIINYRVKASGRERRYTIGQYPAWKTIAARAEAKRLRQEIDRGFDPLADIETARAAPTMQELSERYEQAHLPKLRPSTQRNNRALLKNDILPALGAKKVAAITYADIDALHRKITARGAPYPANRAVALLSKMFNLAIRWGMRGDNPATGIERNREHKRTQYLHPRADLPRFLDALRRYPADRADNARVAYARWKNVDARVIEKERWAWQGVHIIMVLLATGCRPHEACAMRWDQLDPELAVWTKPSSHTKQKADHVVNLHSGITALLAEIYAAQKAHAAGAAMPAYVFPGRAPKTHRQDIGRVWDTVCHMAGLADIVPDRHDKPRIKPRVTPYVLRHSFASLVANAPGGSLQLIGSLLGHTQVATTHRYSHLFSETQRAAVAHVGGLLGLPDPSADEAVE